MAFHSFCPTIHESSAIAHPWPFDNVSHRVATVNPAPVGFEVELDRCVIQTFEFDFEHNLIRMSTCGVR